jgi:hypothetical protein
MTHHNSEHPSEGSKTAGEKPESELSSSDRSGQPERAAQTSDQGSGRPDGEPHDGLAGGEPPEIVHNASHEGVEPHRVEPEEFADEGPGVEPPPAPPPKPRKGLTFGRILLILIILAGGVVGAAFAFRDEDERLRAIADSVESVIQNPQGLMSDIQEKLALLLGESPKQPQVAVKEPLPTGDDHSSGRAPASPQREEPGQPPAIADLESAPSKPVESAPEAKPQPPAPVEEKPQALEPAPEAQPKALQSEPEAKQEALQSEPEVQPQAPGLPPSGEPSSTAGRPDQGQVGAEIADREAALLKRVDKLEQVAQSALKAAEEARAERLSESAEKAGSGTAPLKEREYLAALEGRIDEVASEIRAVRERLDAPKNDARAPQESSEVKGQPAPKGDVAELVVIAQSLNQELEKGKPYKVELTALTALGVDSELLAALAPAAERGAMTPAQLLQGFRPVAKRLRAIEAPKSTGSYLAHIARNFGRLIRVRPVNETPSAAISDHVEAIEAALKHGDAGAAVQAFDKLPEDAKTEESAFGELLQQRHDAEKAAASILSGAIAALGRNKS